MTITHSTYVLVTLNYSHALNMWMIKCCRMTDKFSRCSDSIYSHFGWQNPFFFHSFWRNSAALVHEIGPLNSVLFISPFYWFLPISQRFLILFYFHTSRCSETIFQQGTHRFDRSNWTNGAILLLRRGRSKSSNFVVRISSSFFIFIENRSKIRMKIKSIET